MNTLLQIPFNNPSHPLNPLNPASPINIYDNQYSGEEVSDEFLIGLAIVFVLVVFIILYFADKNFDKDERF